MATCKCVNVHAQASKSFGQLFVRGLLANWLVSLAVWQTMQLRCACVCVCVCMCVCVCVQRRCVCVCMCVCVCACVLVCCIYPHSRSWRYFLRAGGLKKRELGVLFSTRVCRGGRDCVLSAIAACSLLSAKQIQSPGILGVCMSY